MLKKLSPSFIDTKRNRFVVPFIIFLIGVIIIVFYPHSYEEVPRYNNDKLSVVVLDFSKLGFSFFLKYIIGFVFILAAIFFLLYNYLKNRKKERNTTDNFLKLTQTENKVIELIEAGMYNKEIANELNVSLSTIKTHINSIYKKLDISSRPELKKALKNRGSNT